ncbi:hypothetical protein [Streptomyces sp. NPDC058086]|uniref:hypothetical protein n=1 Tax=Streptomyces sp. NPDC058086 TaxID=3346334 RepID=UPI0036F0B3BD
MRAQQEAKDELRAKVWLPADASRRLRAVAAGAGLSPEQVLASPSSPTTSAWRATALWLSARSSRPAERAQSGAAA